MSSDAGRPHQGALDDLQALVSYIEGVYRAVLNRPPELAEVEKYSNAMYQGLSAIDFFHLINGSRERLSHAKLFVVPGSYQSPVANPAELRDYVRRLAGAGPELPGIAVDRAAMIATWETLLPFMTACPFQESATSGYHYYWQNPYYGYGDALVMHAMLRAHPPKRYIEIGSGFSSACAIDTIDHFLGGECELTFIEPHADRLLGVLGARASRARILNVPVQAVALETFDELEADDVLFIDSSHVFRTGSDVCFELFEILPRLAPGVRVHIHDIAWPFDYPEEWILQQNRSYNEAYAVRAFLFDNPHWRIAFFNDYFVKFEGPRVRQTFPIVTTNFGGALWLERC